MEQTITFKLFKTIKNFPNKPIIYDGKEIEIEKLMEVIYKLFYEKKGQTITAAEITKELVEYNEILKGVNFNKFSDRVMRRRLYKMGLIDILNTVVKDDNAVGKDDNAVGKDDNTVGKDEKCIRTLQFYPTALILKIENNDTQYLTKKYKIYDFTLTREGSKINLSEIFSKNFEEIFEDILLNFYEPSLELKYFLELFPNYRPEIILDTLIKIVKNTSTGAKALYDDETKLKKAVANRLKSESNQFKEYKKKFCNNMPAYPKEFVTVNRADELNSALRYLEKHSTYLINGVGGVGKSTLARALVDCRSERIPEPLWFNFDHNPDAKLGDILENIAMYLDAPEIMSFKLERREIGKLDIEKLISELHKREEIWLIFDNLDTILCKDQCFLDGNTELLFFYLKKYTHNAKIIITSRMLPKLKTNDPFIEADEEKLKGLRTDFAVDYLKKNGLSGAEPKILEELVTGVDGHPLALNLLIELVKKKGVIEVLVDLSRYQERKVEVIVKKLFNKLVGDEKELLERISVYRGSVTQKGIEKMFAENTPKNADEILMDKSLLETDLNGNYWLHPLVKEFSYEDLKNKKEAHVLAYEYYDSIPLPEDPSKKEDLQPAIEAHYHACEAGEYDLAAQKIRNSNLHVHLDNWGDYTTLKDICRRLLPQEPFKDKALLSDKKIESRVFGKLGSVYLQLGKADIALNYCKKALEITKETGEKNEEINLLINMGTSYRYQGELEKEIGCYKQALQIARDIRDSYEETYILAKLAYEFYYWGDIQKEIERYESAIKTSEERGNEERRGELLALLGTVYSNQGKHEKAIDDYCKIAVKIANDLKIKRLQEDCLGYLGFAYRCSGNKENLDEALKHYQQALDIAIEIKDRIGEGRRCGSIGIVYSIQGKQIEIEDYKEATEYYKKAIDNYEKALKISKETGDRGGEGKWLGCMGLAYSDLKEDYEAIEYYKQARDVCKKIGYRRGECEERGFIGNAFSDLGKYEEAIKQYEMALDVAKEIKDKGKEENRLEALKDKKEIWLGALGLTYRDLGKHEKAIWYYEQALEISQEIEDRSGEETWLGYMGLAYSAMGMQAVANNYYKKALEISLNVKEKDWKETWLEALGLKYNDLKKDEKLSELYEQALKTLKETGNKQRRGIQLGNFDLYPRGAR